MEPLEPRQLLSSSPVVIGDTPDADAKSLVYTDNDGTVVNVNFKRGCIEVKFDREDAEWNITKSKAVVDGPAEITVVSLLDSSPRSTLKFSTSAPGGEDSEADEYTWVDCIVGPDLGLGQLLADKIEIGRGGIDIDHGAKLCKIGNAYETVLDFGDGDKLTFFAGYLDGVDLNFTGTIASIKVDEWSYGQITAGAVGNVKSAGYFGASIESDSSIGKVTCRQLEGDLVAHAGSIGNITVKGVVVADSEEEEWYFDGGNILSETIYASASIGNITLLGGSIGEESKCAITAEKGSIGKITAKFGKYRTPLFSESGRRAWETWYSQANIEDVEVNALKGIGLITVLGGSCGGKFMTNGRIGNVTVQGIVDRQHGTFIGGGFVSCLGGWQIGDISVTGGVSSIIKAGNRLGDITIRSQTVKVDPDDFGGETDGAWNGMVMQSSEPMRLALLVGGPEWRGLNRIGAIRLIGVPMILEGEIYDLAGKLRINSKPVKNVMAYSAGEDDYVFFDTVGGPDQLTNNLSLLENQIPQPIFNSSDNGGSGGLIDLGAMGYSWTWTPPTEQPVGSD
jgi:hypothetical protein